LGYSNHQAVWQLERTLRWGYLLAGLSLGLSQYFYSSSKALLGVILAAAFVALLFRRARFRQAIPELCIVSIAALAVVFPLAWYYKSDPNAFLAPFARVSMMNTIVSSKASFWTFLSQQVPISGAYTHTVYAGIILVPAKCTASAVHCRDLFWHWPDLPALP
jgi:hypothetical protein